MAPVARHLTAPTFEWVSYQSRIVSPCEGTSSSLATHRQVGAGVEVGSIALWLEQVLGIKAGGLERASRGVAAAAARVATGLRACKLGGDCRQDAHRDARFRREQDEHYLQVGLRHGRFSGCLGPSKQSAPRRSALCSTAPGYTPFQVVSFMP